MTNTLTTAERKRYGPILRAWKADIEAILDGPYVPEETHSNTSHLNAALNPADISGGQVETILALKGEGMETREIANRLSIHHATVKSVVRNGEGES